MSERVSDADLLRLEQFLHKAKQVVANDARREIEITPEGAELIAKALADLRALRRENEELRQKWQEAGRVLRGEIVENEELRKALESLSDKARQVIATGSWPEDNNVALNALYDELVEREEVKHGDD